MMSFSPSISFHEATLLSCISEGKNLQLGIEGAHVEKTIKNVLIRLKDVNTILRDGIPVDQIRAEEAEILTLELTGVSVYLIVECTDFESHKSQTHTFRITCKAIDVELL